MSIADSPYRDFLRFMESPGVEHWHGDLNVAALLWQFQGLATIAIEIAQLCLLPRHRRLALAAIQQVEGPWRCGCLVEDMPPDCLELNGVSQRHSGVLVYCVLRDQVCNAFLRGLLFPVVNPDAGRFRIAAKIHWPYSVAIAAGRDVQELRQNSVVLLAPD